MDDYTTQNPQKYQYGGNGCTSLLLQKTFHSAIDVTETRNTSLIPSIVHTSMEVNGETESIFKGL